MAASYLSRVRAISGSTTAITTSAEVVDFLRSGANYVVNNIPKELLFFAYTNTNVSSSAGVVVPQNTIISVSRGAYDADRIDSKYGYARSSTLTSLYKGTAFHPSYIVDSGKVYIDPTPTTATSALGTVTYIKMPTIGTTTSSTNLTIAPVENPIILYAAALDCAAISSYYKIQATTQIATIITNVTAYLLSVTGTLPTAFSTTVVLPADFSVTLSITTVTMPTLTISVTKVSDALLKAQYYIDSATQLSGSAYDASYHMGQEDTELVSAAVQVASQELNRAQTSIAEQNLKLQDYAQHVKTQSESLMASLSRYKAHVEKESAEMGADVGKYKAEVEKEVSRISSSLQRSQLYLGKAQAGIQEISVVNGYLQAASLDMKNSETLFARADMEIKGYIAANTGAYYQGDKNNGVKQ